MSPLCNLGKRREVSTDCLLVSHQRQDKKLSVNVNLIFLKKKQKKQQQWLYMFKKKSSSTRELNRDQTCLSGRCKERVPVKRCYLSASSPVKDISPYCSASRSQLRVQMDVCVCGNLHGTAFTAPGSPVNQLCCMAAFAIRLRAGKLFQHNRRLTLNSWTLFFKIISRKQRLWRNCLLLHV